MESREKTIFYSWQSDLPKQANHFFIRDALRSAIKRIARDEVELTIRLDHDTKETPGSPDIKETIFNKIEKSEIFVCDVSIINNDQTNFRRTPNPNVLIELGYAAAKIGWEKIVLIFNNEYGRLEDLPFDIRSNRVTVYNCPANISKEEKAKSERSLEDVFFIAIKTILDSDALSNNLKAEAFDENIRRRRDLETLAKIMQAIRMSAIDNFFQSARCGFILYEILDVYESLKMIVTSSSFYLYNKDLNEMLLSFYTHISDALTLGENHFESGKNEEQLFFRSPHPKENAEQWEADHSNFQSSVNLAETVFRKLVHYLHENYIELEISNH